MVMVVFLLYWQVAVTLISPTQTEMEQAIHHFEQGMQQKLGDVPSLRSDEFELYLPPSKPAFVKNMPTKVGLYHYQGFPSVYMGRMPETNEPYFMVILHGGPLESLQRARITDFLEWVVISLATTPIALIIMWLLIKKFAGPVVTLQRQVKKIDINAEKFPIIDRDDEIGQLSLAYSQMWQRLRGFVKREQEFTRFASHELRSPVMIMRGNLELLESQLKNTELNNRIYKRLDTATRRMSMLIETFLWLGRESKEHQHSLTRMDQTDLTRLYNELCLGYTDQQLSRLDCEISDVRWNVSLNTLSIMLDNLIRNALQHTNSDVLLRFNDSGFTIENEYVEDKKTQGEGIGLIIVERICSAENWQCIKSKDNDVFRIDVRIA